MRYFALFVLIIAGVCSVVLLFRFIITCFVLNNEGSIIKYLTDFVFTKGDVVSKTESEKRLNYFSNFRSVVSELCRISL